MDQTLKQRLVGAAVITALAAIFIPMLFDDPIEEHGKIVRELEIPPSPDITFMANKRSIPVSVEDVLAEPEAKLVTPPDRAVLQKNQPGKKPELVRWVIQIGSFEQRQNALVLRDKLRKQGFSAFVETVEVKNKGNRYRVRVGPELDKKRALTTQKKLEKLNQLESILISE
jgi:DedD protein